MAKRTRATSRRTPKHPPQRTPKGKGRGRSGSRKAKRPSQGKKPVKTSPRAPQPRSVRQSPKGRALAAVATMRKEGKSLSKAAKAAHTTRRTIKKYTPSAVGPKKRGRYAARASDRITRSMRFLTPEGSIALPIRSSTSASRIAEFSNAVRRYLRTGWTDALNPFRGQVIRVHGVAYPFVTDPHVLDRLANAGEVQFEDLYSLTA